jgi:hypothetical protein
MNDELSARLERNFAAVLGEITAPRRSRFERLLLRAHLPEPAARLVASKPAFRWAFALGIFLVLQVAASSGDASQGVDRLAGFLALAPLVPIVGVALSYGVAADRSYEVTVAAPLSGFRLVLVRAVTVLASSAVISMVAILLSPSNGWIRFGWVLPSLAGVGLTLVSGARFGFRRAGIAIGVSWLATVIVTGRIASDPTRLFGLIGQLVFCSVAVVTGLALWMHRRRWNYVVGS